MLILVIITNIICYYYHKLQQNIVINSFNSIEIKGKYSYNTG